MITGISIFRPGVGLLSVDPEQVVELVQGDTLRITASYSYTAQWPTTATFIGYIGSSVSQKASGQITINLPTATTPTSGQVTINIQTSAGGIFGVGTTPPGTWGVGVMIKGTTVYDEIPDCIIVTAAPSGGGFDISSIIGMVIIMMMMSIMMPMMEEM